MIKIFITAFLTLCLFSSCKKCPTAMLCPAANPTYRFINGSDSATLYIPNAFTPDQDGINDYFMVYGHNIAAINCGIYSGNTLIHQLSGFNDYWDGLVNGHRTVGIYNLKITGTNIWGNTFSIEGTISSIGGALLGDTSLAITENTSLNYTKAQFPDQNNHGTFDPYLPDGQYIITTNVIVCH